MAGDVTQFVILYFGIIIQYIWNKDSNIKQSEIQFFLSMLAMLSKSILQDVNSWW